MNEVKNMLRSSLKKYEKKFIQQGKKEGEQKGKKEGKIEGKKEDALKMLELNYSVNDICAVTGLEKDVVEKLAK